jgi:hypothetical protein
MAFMVLPQFFSLFSKATFSDFPFACRAFAAADGSYHFH